MTTTTTTAQTPDAVALFNSQLAHAKLGALALLQDLMASITDPDAPIGAALRELRLVATAILRTQPIKAPAATAPLPPTPTQQGDPTPAAPPASPLHPPHTASRSNLNPTRRAAIADVHALLRAGNPHIIRALASSTPHAATNEPPARVPSLITRSPPHTTSTARPTASRSRACRRTSPETIALLRSPTPAEAFAHGVGLAPDD